MCPEKQQKNNTAQSPFAVLEELKDAMAQKKKEEEEKKKKNKGRKKAKAPRQLTEEELFRAAMKGVSPIKGRKIKTKAETKKRPPQKSFFNVQDEKDKEALAALSELVSGKSPFPLEHTSEYLEEERLAAIPDLSKKLHQGAFSIQGYIDLHRMDELTALNATRDFIHESLLLGKKCLAIIHGRGLSSKKGPVLKKAVINWLKTGPFRRHILAMSSAPPWDGGTGVTYVLLKRRPSKRQKKKKAWKT